MKSRLLNIIILAAVPVLWGVPSPGQNIRNIGTSDLEQILNTREDRLHVINFWATWCAPCVKEFPGFEELSKVYEPKGVRFVMVSLDFPKEVDKTLRPFVAKNKTSLDIALMQDLDYDKWIRKVDQDWYGDLPATLVFNNSRKIRIFHSGEIDEMSLRKIIEDNIR